MVEDPWAGIAPVSQQLVGHRVAGRHALDVYWVKSVGGAPGLLIRGIDPNAIPYSRSKPKGFLLDVEHHHDTVDLRMFLQDPGDREVFHTLCCDVVAFSALDSTASGATKSIFRRLAHWHSLMSKARIEAMGPHEIRGLIGELLTLDQLIGAYGFSIGLQCWVAPDDHAQDFVVPDGIIEVKSRLTSGRQHVRISSLEQLESAHLSLSLLVVELSYAAGDEGVTLNQVCDDLALRARATGEDQEDALHVALLKRGYTRQDAYDVQAYRVAGRKLFEVRADFPKLGRSDVDARIARAEYVLDLSQLGDFEVDPKLQWATWPRTW